MTHVDSACGDNLPKKAYVRKVWQESETFDLVGRVHLDSLNLYRKYTYEERHTYRLDAIGEVEVGENKVPVRRYT